MDGKKGSLSALTKVDFDYLHDYSNTGKAAESGNLTPPNRPCIPQSPEMLMTPSNGCQGLPTGESLKNRTKSNPIAPYCPS